MVCISFDFPLQLVTDSCNWLRNQQGGSKLALFPIQVLGHEVCTLLPLPVRKGLTLEPSIVITTILAIIPSIIEQVLKQRCILNELQ